MSATFQLEDAARSPLVSVVQSLLAQRHGSLCCDGMFPSGVAVWFSLVWRHSPFWLLWLGPLQMPWTRLPPVAATRPPPDAWIQPSTDAATRPLWMPRQGPIQLPGYTLFLPRDVQVVKFLLRVTNRPATNDKEGTHDLLTVASGEDLHSSCL